MSLDHLRPNIRAMAGYTPGEQPRDGLWLKLNTNENPYPPSPKVVEAVTNALTADRLRKYPDPLGADFRHAAARILGVDPDSILIGNGSDDILTILTRAFVPEGGRIVSPTPSYLLYRTLAHIQGAQFQTVSYTDDWKLPPPPPTGWAGALVFVANPNSPSGTLVDLEQLESWLAARDGILVVDEAYVDFAETNALPLLQKHRNVLITRTLSKSYSLAGIRFGFGIGDPELIRQLIKVKDSYNCDALSLAAAAAAISDQDYFRSVRDKIVATRRRMSVELANLGFEVTPSHANFVWCRRFDRPLEPIFLELKKRFILVRLMRYDGYGDGLRISVGADAEIDRLLAELRGIV